jgi:hypothetical protein
MSIDEEGDFVDSEIYEMPIKIDQGPIYGFAGGSSVGDKIKIMLIE